MLVFNIRYIKKRKEENILRKYIKDLKGPITATKGTTDFSAIIRNGLHHRKMVRGKILSYY